MLSVLVAALSLSAPRLPGRRKALELGPALLAAAASPSLLRPAVAAETSLPSSGFEAPSGLRIYDFREGEGSTPRWGQLVRFHYIGYTLTADALNPIDNTYARGLPYLTKHGNGFTARGIEEALHTMRPGGRRRIILPANIGFTGDKGPLPPGEKSRDALFGAVGRGESLVFDLELLSAENDLLDRGDYDDGDASELASGPKGRSKDQADADMAQARQARAAAMREAASSSQGGDSEAEEKQSAFSAGNAR